MLTCAPINIDVRPNNKMGARVYNYIGARVYIDARVYIGACLYIHWRATSILVARVI